MLAAEMRAGMDRPGGMLFGRRTWQDLSTAWAQRDDGNPFTAHLNTVTKYVASTSLDDAAKRQNSVLLRGEATRTVAELKVQRSSPTTTGTNDRPTPPDSELLDLSSRRPIGVAVGTRSLCSTRC